MGGNLGLWVPRRRGRRCYARQEFLDVSPGVDRDWATPSQNRAWDAVSLRLGWKNGEINSPLQTPTVQIAGCAIVAEWGGNLGLRVPRRRGRRCYARQEFLDVSPDVDRDWATPSL